MKLELLRERAEQGEGFTYLFFWGDKPKRSGGIDQSGFSQWYPAPFDIDGIIYPTAEHFMMAEKARLFSAQHHLEQILQAAHPGAAKNIGRLVQGFDEEVWNAQRYSIVVRGNQAKFEQHSALQELLLTTGTRILAEASPLDRIWGIGLAADDPQAENPLAW